MKFKHNPLLGNGILPADIVLAPEWWNKNTGITFDRDFFFHPLKRVEEEQRMEKILYERWGKYGLGSQKGEIRPEIGAVHLASGYLLQEMAGCKVEYSEAHPPQVLPAHQEIRRLNTDSIFRSQAFKEFRNLTDKLKGRFAYLSGDVNWGGILNIAMDLHGEDIFADMMMAPDDVTQYFADIAAVIEKFTIYLTELTGSTSISVNRNVRHLQQPVFLHSECSHTMISEDDYENFLLPFDQQWSNKRPFGIHYCGPDPHRMAASFEKIPHLDFLDLGWGGNVKLLRDHLPDTFLNIRLSPVELARQTNEEIRSTITKLVHESANPYLTGICCINLDDSVTDDRIDTIFQTVEDLRYKYADKA